MARDKKKMRSFRVYNGAGDDYVESNVPPHLAHSSWINFEASSALSVLGTLSDELKDLKKKVSVRRVHKARVALRRWFSVWKVLEQDGWESKHFKKSVSKPLKNVLEALGELRDMDVALELAENLGVTDETLDDWKKQRKTLKKHLKKRIDSVDVKDLLDEIEDYLHDRAEKVEKSVSNKRAKESAFDHLDNYLSREEDEVRALAQTAQSPEELHKFRLGVKRWRYLLTEFFGLTNLELVKAQQVLGQIHDLDRLTPILQSNPGEELALSRIRDRRGQLLKEIGAMRTRLPFGLRPHITSLKRGSAADFADLRT
jgi:CHAD domain-containing protein